MTARDGDDATWPGTPSDDETRPARPPWPGANRAAHAPLPSRRETARPRSWLPAALWVVCGVVIGSILTLALLFLAGPRPAPLPVSAGAGQVTVTVNDAYLTTAIRQASSSVPLLGGSTSWSAHAVPGDRILLTGSGSGGGFAASAPISMSLQPLVNNGVLSAQVVTAQIGGMPLPGFLDAQLGNAINSQLATVGQSALSGSHFTVTSVTTTNGDVILTLGAAS